MGDRRTKGQARKGGKSEDRHGVPRLRNSSKPDSVNTEYPIFNKEFPTEEVREKEQTGDKQEK